MPNGKFTVEPILVQNEKILSWIWTSIKAELFSKVYKIIYISDQNDSSLLPT